METGCEMKMKERKGRYIVRGANERFWLTNGLKWLVKKEWKINGERRK